ncbi:MAG: putative D-glycero-alpha-D-manno-heptose 1-phosphate guanylyltransferase [Promethearchaeota archaeon]|nr:MAG: putative D-glycero-alpha-D-manno-heptose 1-phosphate guanylyltransferase [Candidatus Lokiarchaeota archaeon]
MVTLLSRLKNKTSINIEVILLCAGKGTRFGDITQRVPKPLIKVKKLTNKPILYYIIYFLVKAQFKSIKIVTGHLSEKIEAYITSLRQKEWLQEIELELINSKDQYKRGPLYSFLSLQENRVFFRRRTLYIILPGDTLFEPSYFHAIRGLINSTKKIIDDHPVVFYIHCKKEDLQKIFNYNKEKAISIIKLIPTQKNYGKKVQTKSLKEYGTFEFINHVYPTFLLSPNIIKMIIKYEKQIEVSSIKEIINYLSKRGYTIYAKELEQIYLFYDIDDQSTLQEVYFNEFY